MERKQPAHQRKKTRVFAVYIFVKERNEFTIIDIVLVFILRSILMLCTQRFCERRNLLCQSKLHHKPCMK